MASVIALLEAEQFQNHAKQVTPGAVLPIDSYVTDERSFATQLVARFLDQTFEVQLSKSESRTNDYGKPAKSYDLVRITRAGRRR